MHLRRWRHAVRLAAAVLVVFVPVPPSAAAQVAAPAASGIEETLNPNYVVFPTVRPLWTRHVDFDRFDLRILRRSGPSRARSFHLRLTISAGGRVLVSRTSTTPAAADGGGLVRAVDLAPLWGAVRYGRLVSTVPWSYDGFTFIAEVREDGPGGLLVYRHRDPNKVVGISARGLFDAHPLMIPALCAFVFAIGAGAEALLRKPHRRAILRFALMVLAIITMFTWGVSRYAALALVAAALLTPLVPVRVRQRLVPNVADRRSREAVPWPRWWLRWSPALFITALTLYGLVWHHALIVAYRFSPADFSEYTRLVLGVYFVATFALAAAWHGWLATSTAGVRGRRAVVALGVIFVLSGVMRILDGGAFLFSASHVDEDFWRLAFTKGNLRFAQDPAALTMLAVLGIALAGFLGLLQRSRRWAAAVAPLCRPDAAGRTAVSVGALILKNGAAALLVVVMVHEVWMAAWAGPRREISGDVQQNFVGVPEIKFVQPLIRAYLAAPPSVPRALEPEVVNKLAKAGVRLNSANPDYPLLKPSIFLDALRRRDDTPRVPAGTNVIIITVESLSRSLLREDIHRIKGLTPSFDDFRANSLSFDNLFSADFPTIKGMIATFGSYAFDHRGLTIFTDVNNPLKSRFLFLSDILHARGYETFHVQSDLGSFGNTTSILLKHHYDQVHGAESPAILNMRIHPLNKPWGIYDEDLYRFVVSMLKNHDPRRPFFMTIAPTDTHFPYMNLAPMAATGGNELLNSVHGTDRAFGLFWEYFKTSPYRDNTMVFLTGDHAMVTRALRSVDANMRLSEFDYIAAMLYVPGHASTRGRRIDTICTQLDIPPTLLDMMDIDLVNPFLGLSIFAERPLYPLALAREIPVDPVTGGERPVVRELNWTPGDHAAWQGYLRGLAAADRITPPARLPD